MLVYSEIRYMPTDLNIIILQDSAKNYLYIHRMLYDDAVVLSHIFNNDYQALAAKISPTGDIPEDRQDIEFFYSHVPAPVNILAPYLLLCVERFDTLEDMIGAIHVMSNTFSFRKLPDIPKEVRLNSMTFSMSITEEYQLSWDLFFSKCIVYSEDLLLNRGSAPVATVSTSTETVSAAPKPEYTNGVVAPEDVDPNGTYLTAPDGTLIDFNFDPKEYFGEDFDPNEFDGTDLDTTTSDKVEEAAPEPEPEPAKPAKATGMDFLKSIK